MLPCDFPQRNHVFEKPKNMTDEQCFELPVFVGRNPEGFPCIISCWRLSKEDLDEINRTGVVWLNVISNTQPPVSVTVETPFE